MDQELYEKNRPPFQEQGWEQAPGPGYGTAAAKRENYLALASLVMGIMSLVTACCFFPAFVLGGLAVIFAGLSRVEQQMDGKAIAGMVTGIMGFIAGTAFGIFWIMWAV